MGFHPWSRSYLGPAYARIAEAPTSFPVPPEGSDSGRRMSPLCVSDPPQAGPIGCSPPHAPPEGSFHVWPWGSLDTPPKGVVPRYPPRGVLRDCSRPVPGSCRGVASPLTGGFPHKMARSGQSDASHCVNERRTTPIKTRLCRTPVRKAGGAGSHLGRDPNGF